MSPITKEQLRERARAKVKSLEFSITQTAFADSRSELEEELELARIALASLEAVPVGTFKKGPCGYHPSFHEDAVPLYTAPPAPVSVPAAMEMDDDFDSAFEHGKAVGWNACRAAMPQGAEQQNRQQNIPENIPATQFKPVADLYGLTSPTGSETSFTFDAVEARDFIDGGWSCQEYVELERYQNAVAGNSPVIPDDVRRMDWLVSKTVDVREPMVYGSHSLFWSQTITDEEDDYHATKLREQIDAAMEAEQAAAPQQEAK
ncbi:hypothetical protein [Enterobacter hormaechei]|uniref:hypothetical protein n=1 Tax=Enterobacter hormaechei TaxID=158836 RepID=UPI000798AB1B|nr:hypothetical protein [Enterobacter hormaechei]CZV14897.1 Uncharacterised protein [Enterobacter hormaechei]